MRATVTTTRGRVLDVVRDLREVSRVELAEITGLTQATISTTVRSLLNEGLLVESGQREFTGGKPRIKLTLNPRARCAVGVQLGADSIVTCIVDAAGSIVARTRQRGADPHAPERTVEVLAATVERLLRRTGLPREVILGLGLALPGILDLELGTILASESLPGWGSFPIRERLADATGLDVVVDGNAAAAAIGEFWGGGIPPSRALCTVFMGAGISAGIVLNGSVYRGASGNAGALTPRSAPATTSTWPPELSLDELAGPAAVTAAARNALGRRRTSAITLGPPGTDSFSNFEAVAAAAIIGDPLATALIEESAEHVATAALSVANLLDLDLVVLAGPAFAIAGSIYLDVMQRRLAEGFNARAKHGVQVQLSAQIADAAAVGSASLVLQQELAPRSTGVISPLTPPR